MAAPTFEELCERVPALRELEAQVRAVRDDGSGTYFCSNNAWFRYRRALNGLLGVWRRAVDGESPEDEELLGKATSHAVAYEALYPLLPPCRDCGCVGFEVLREEEQREQAEGAG